MSLTFVDTELEGFGMFRFLAPVSVLLLLPALAGIGASIACHNETGLPLPDPVRAVVARAGWAVLSTGVAVLAASLGQIAAPGADWWSIGRNVLIYASIGILTLRLGYPHLAWLPILIYTFVAMVFGHSSSGPGYYWWAVVLMEQVSPGQLVAAGVLISVAVLVYSISSRGLEKHS